MAHRVKVQEVTVGRCVSKSCPQLWKRALSHDDDDADQEAERGEWDGATHNQGGSALGLTLSGKALTNAPKGAFHHCPRSVFI